MTIDWSAIGAGVGSLILGALAWFGGRATKKANTEVEVAKARAEGAQAAAETSVVDLMRQEVERLGKRVEALEAEQRAARNREHRLVNHIFTLERLMRAANLEPPHFDLDAGASSTDL